MKGERKMTTTNANSKLIAALLKDARKGTFTGLITTKRGKLVGRGAERKLYGDDTVHTVIFTGFKYDNLVKRSLDALDAMDVKAIAAEAIAKGVTCFDGRGKKAVERLVTEADFLDAAADLRASFERSLDPNAESTSTTKDVYESLSVDGETVRGGRVYRCTGQPNCKCRDCTGEAKAPKDGTIYVQGLRIWSKVLTPATNGPIPASKSGGKTVAKKLLRSKLPISRYVSYALEPGTDFLLRAGGTAALKAQDDGFVVTDDIAAALSA